MFAMLGIVFANNLRDAFIFWNCRFTSYVLIVTGFFEDAAADAANKAISRHGWRFRIHDCILMIGTTGSVVSPNRARIDFGAMHVYARL